MPEITADQLAARKHLSITVLGEQCYIWAVTQAEHDLILAALREHEERAVRAKTPRWQANGDGSHHCLINGQIVGTVKWGRHTDNWHWRVALLDWHLESSLNDAKAAVEKAVTSSLVRCDCVDANGNAWPDCTCDHGWRQAAVEKAVRNG